MLLTLFTAAPTGLPRYYSSAMLSHGSKSFRSAEPSVSMAMGSRSGVARRPAHPARPLFDPYLAVHGSRIEALPHQITAVYGEMLPRQPLRFLLADDPGAGKTIMAGLFIKELMIRGDLERCLIVAPGNLVEQWQDELTEKFDLTFDILIARADRRRP